MSPSGQAIRFRTTSHYQQFCTRVSPATISTPCNDDSPMSSAAARNLAVSTPRFLFNECQMHLRVPNTPRRLRIWQEEGTQFLRAIGVRDQLSVPLMIPNLHPESVNDPVALLSNFPSTLRPSSFVPSHFSSSCSLTSSKPPDSKTFSNPHTPRLHSLITVKTSTPTTTTSTGRGLVLRCALMSS
jgi:hypothetical protein